ncbi:MAG: glycosyltransferase, partial [Pirellulaceae bacterium]|nr:glycosyltransferase [Pirellulaceae bacterium]
SHYQCDLHNHSFVTLVLDDYIHLQAYHADLILNQNPQIVSSQYAEKCGSAELLLGPTFALLRQEMLSAFNEDSGDDLLQKQSHGLRMLITLGGTDPGDVTQTVLRAIEKMAPRFQLQVKLLSAVPNLKLPAADVTLIPFSNNMAELYEWANVAICAGGSTNWEMCYFGIPRLAIVLADNQRSIVDYLHRMDCCLHGGWFQQLRLDAIIEQLNPLLVDSAKRHAMRQANRQLIDGQGAERVTSRIMEKIRQSRVTRTSKPD